MVPRHKTPAAAVLFYILAAMCFTGAVIWSALIIASASKVPPREAAAGFAYLAAFILWLPAGAIFFVSLVLAGIGNIIDATDCTAHFAAASARIALAQLEFAHQQAGNRILHGLPQVDH